MNTYQILWYNDYESPPFYLLVDVVRASTPEEALEVNLKKATRRVRDIYGLSKSVDVRIQKYLYALRSKGLVSVYDIRKKQPRKRKPLKKA